MRTRRLVLLLATSLVTAVVSGCGAEEGAPPLPPGAPAPTPPPEAAKLFQKPGTPPAGKKSGECLTGRQVHCGNRPVLCTLEHRACIAPASSRHHWRGRRDMPPCRTVPRN